MVNAQREALNALLTWFAAAKSRMQRITSGNGVAGHRAGPTQSGNNDTKIGARLDYGERFTKDGKEYQRLNFQLNKGAERKTIKELANKDPHKVWASADVPLGKESKTDEAAFEAIFEDLEKDLEERS